MAHPWTETHPFIEFAFRADRIGPRLWTLLGQAVSTSQHIAWAPLLPDTSSQMMTTWLVRGAQATTAIEGNTLTEAQVRSVLQGRNDLPDSRSYQADEVRNVLAAMNRLASGGASHEVTVDIIHELNEQVLRGLETRPGVFPGRIRDGGVAAGVYVAPDYHEVPDLLRRYVEWVNGPYRLPDIGVPKLAEVILRAVLAHVLFAWIHPYGDGNGRTARLIEQCILLGGGVPTVSAHLLNNHYNQTRDRYYDKLNEARLVRDPLVFAEYAVQGLVDGLQEQIAFVQSQQFQTMWARLVMLAIDGASIAKARQRALAIDLGQQAEAVSKAAIPRLSVEMAGHYAGKTPKTVTRDLNALVASGLVVERVPGRYEANRATVYGLLPPRFVHPGRGGNDR